jgi:hypothetical protein
MKALFNHLKFSRILIGDWVLFFTALLLLIFLFKTYWHVEPATKLQIRQGDKIYAILSLNQSRTLLIHGPLGDSKILIQNGQVRFESSSCRNQYCVHQGWLKHSGQVAICLPNQVSLELLGADKPFDSLNY